jgi:phospholipid transport system substrate-binding protein
LFDRRVFLTFIAALPSLASARAQEAANDSADAVAAVQALQNNQIDVVRRASKMSLQQRFDALRPALSSSLDLDGMARLVYGPGWDKFSDAQREDWTKAFGDYVAASYAQQFEFTEAKGFERDAKAESREGALVVSTKLIPVKGAPMPIDYVVKNTAKGWRVADILANGSISEVTQWRRALRGIELKDLRQRVASLLEH